MKRTVLLLFIGLLAGFYYLQSFTTIGTEALTSTTTLHREIIAHTSDSPFRYRVLSAWLVQPLTGNGSAVEIAFGYVIAHFIILPVMFVALDAWLRRWLSPIAALVGVLAVAYALPVMFINWNIALYSAIEVVFLCIGLLLIADEKRNGVWTASVVAVIALATLNRETAVLIPLAYITTCWREPGYWRRAPLFMLAWGAVFFGLRLWLGSAPDSVPIAVALHENLTNWLWSDWGFIKAGVFIPIFAAYIVGLRRAPGFLRRLLPVALIYVALFLVFAYWHEVRLFLPLLVMILPVAIGSFSGQRPEQPLKIQESSA